MYVCMYVCMCMFFLIISHCHFNVSACVSTSSAWDNIFNKIKKADHVLMMVRENNILITLNFACSDYSNFLTYHFCIKDVILIIRKYYFCIITLHIYAFNQHNNHFFNHEMASHSTHVELRVKFYKFLTGKIILSWREKNYFWIISYLQMT